MKALTRLLLAVALTGLLTAAPVHAQPTPAAEAGWQALNARDAEKASAAFNEALVRNPRDPMLHFGAGLAAQLLGRPRDAMTSLRRALELAPEFVEAYVALGLIEYQQGELDDAIGTYERALARAPSSLEIRGKLEEWRKEAAVHRTLEHWNDGQFSVSFEGQTHAELGQRAFDVLRSAHLRIVEALGTYPSGRVNVILYSEQQFRDVTRLPEWVGGSFDGQVRIPVQGAQQNLEEFDRVLVHELTHALLTGLAGRGVPGWVHEGLASYFEPRDVKRAISRLRSARVVLPLSRLEGTLAALGPEGAALAYEESLVAANLLMERLGSSTGLFVQYLGRGQSWEQVLRLFGMDPADFEAELWERIGLTPSRR